jgi:hypothetical protein
MFYLARPWHGGRGHGGRGSSDRGAGGSFLFQHGPVKGVVILVVEGAEEDAEQLPEIHVVRGLLEPQAPAVVQIHGELGGETLAEHLNRSRHLLFTDFLVFLFLCCSFESLPRQAASVEVHEDVSQALHVVAATLLNTKMGVDGGVSGSSCQVLVLSVRNVLTGPVVSVLFGQSKVDQEEFVAVTPNTHQEVVWLDVTMNEILIVDVFNSPDHLIRKHEDSLHCESPGAKVEEVLEAWSEEVHDEDVVVPLLAIPPNVGDAHAALEDLVELALIQQLRVASLHALQLYSNLLSVGDVDAEVDVSKTPGPDLPDQPVLPPHDELGAGGGGCTRHAVLNLSPRLDYSMFCVISILS